MKILSKPVKLKEKKCKSCEGFFQPTRPLQQVCSPKCAVSLAKEKAEKKLQKETRKWKIEGLEKLKTKSDFEKDLEKEVNHIVRLIDKGHECISSGAKKYIVNAGHLYSVGAYPALRYNLLNIYNQSVADNFFKSSNGVVYKERIKEVFGVAVSEEIEGLKLKYKELHLSIPELKDKIRIARQVVRHLKEFTKEYETPFNAVERISERRIYNDVLGIY